MLRKLASQTAIYGVSTILVKFINYLLTPYLTYRLSTEVIGVQSYFYSIIPLGLVMLTMGLETGYFRFISKCDTPEKRKELFSTLFSSIALLSLAFSGIIWALSDDIYSTISSFGIKDITIIPIAGAIISIDAVLAIIYAKIREEGRAKWFLLTRVFNVLVNVGLCVFFYSFVANSDEGSLLHSMWNPERATLYVFIANLIASSATLLLLTREIRLTKKPINTKVLKTVMIFSLPLMLSGLSGTANEVIDRQLLVYLLPESQNMAEIGIYSSVMKIAALLYLFIQMYRFAAEPFFLSNIKESDFKTTNARALKHFTIASIGVFLFITLYIDIFKYFVGEEFRVGISIIPVLLLSNVLIGIYVNLSFWYKITEKTFFALVITLIGFTVSIALNLLLIPKIGYEGAAWARLGCEAVMVGVSYGLNQKYYPIKYDLREIARYALLGAVLFACGWWSPLAGIAKILINTIILSIFILFFIKREKIDVNLLAKQIINKLKKR